MTLFDTLRQDGKAEELFNEFPKQQNGSSFLTRAASLHALAQFDQRLVEALDAEQAQPRTLDFDSHYAHRGAPSYTLTAANLAGNKGWNYWTLVQYVRPRVTVENLPVHDETKPVLWFLPPKRGPLHAHISLGRLWFSRGRLGELGKNYRR